MAKKKIVEYRFYPGIGINDSVYPNAYALITANKNFIQKEVTAWIARQVQLNATGFVGYTYDAAKCERDTGYNVDAWAHDLTYGGNQETTRIANTYWEGDVAQLDGDRQAEILAKGFTRDLINNHIITNSPQGTPYQTAVTQVTTANTGESAASTRIQILAQIVIDVITTGTSALPTFERKGLGHIRFPGNYDTSDLLIVTNTTKATVIYNFTDPLKGGKVTREDDVTPRDSGGYVIKYDTTDANSDADDDFPKYLQTTDSIAVLDLNFNTSSMATSDELQIFIDSPEQTIRPYDFGTDAIERIRVAQPLSMLDADFEYGLQPTKWSAIGMMRGYPSIYELPGTDTQVLSVVTDASSGTAGIGASRITVTTIGAHGFEPGTPITIKALEDAVGGAARAEGSFIIDDVPTPNTFRFFAKSKVGTTNGQVLSTTYTQLRQGAFYTGASVGQPQFIVASNGTNGTMTLALAAQTGENRLAFTGDVPEIGAPIVNAAFPTGTQVTGINSTPGGTPLSMNLTQDINPGNTSFTVSSTTNIAQGQAANNGTGDAIFVNSIVGNTVNMSGSFTSTIARNTQTYTGVSGTITAPVGTNAQFDINRSGVNYSITTVSQIGSGYKAGDVIKITGNNLGGFTPANDAEIVIATVNGSGGVLTATISGTALSGSVTYQDVASTYNHGSGTWGASTVDINYENDAYSSISIASPNDTTGYAVNDGLRIVGTSVLGGSGQDGSQNDNGNDIVAKVATIGAGGSISSISIVNDAARTGTAPDSTVNYSFGGAGGASFTGGSGSSFEFQIDKQVGATTSYGIMLSNGGSSYNTADVIVCAGTDLGGASPANDLYLRVVAVDGNGGITDVRLEGQDISSAPVPFNGGVFSGKTLTNFNGSGAVFDVTNNGSTYSVAVDTPGTNYIDGQEFTVAGTALGGSSPANDATISISATNSTGASNQGIIQTVSISGSAPSLPTDFSNVAGANQAHAGASGTFDITRTQGAYSIAMNIAGTGYQVGNEITIVGTDLGGAAPTNNATLIVSSIDGSGGVNNATITGTAIGGGTLNLVGGVTLSDFTTAGIPSSSSVNFEALSTIEVTYPYAHGIVPGDTFIVDVNSDDGGTNNHSLAAGSFIATQVPTQKKIRYNTRAPGSIAEFDATSTEDRIQGNVYLRPDSFFVHRPYDGGVQLGTGGPQHGAQAIRQSKKYIRYQSGKGIMYTTGALFAPSYDLLQVTANGTSIGSTITCTTDDTDHGLQVGGGIRLIGINTVGFNGDYVVSDINSEREFEVLAVNALGSTTPELSAKAQVSVKTFHGATVRSGCFDDQNGIFFEYDGTQFSAVQRTATLQLAGVVDIAVDTNTVTGTGTRFREQLKAGDRIVIKGMTHVVSDVISNTQMSVAPDFRGVTNVLSSKLCLVQDKKTEQKDFNRDRMDGTGPSGYNIDISKMQMVGIQYSWYGAGFIDYMLRGADGNFVFGHRMRNSNINTEAFMRTGNMPVRYEVTNEGPVGKLSANVTDTATTLPLEDASFFPPEGGIVYIDNEMIQFTGVDGKNLTGCTRGAQMTNFASGATRTYSAGTAETHTRNTGVPLISNTISPIISHWGSAYITDGGFDFDRGYLFSYKATGTSISTTRYTSFLIRLAPSVSNAIVGDLGERELLNRAQLLLDGLEVTSEPNASGQKGGIVIEGVLNPQNYPVNPNDIGWEGISGLASGGQPSFAQIAAGGSVNWNGGATQTTASATVQADIDSGFNYTRTSQYNDRYSPITIDYSPIQTIGTPLIGAYIESQNPTNAFNAGQYVISGVGPLEGNGFRYRIFYTGPNGTNRASNLSTTSTTLKFIYKTYTGFTNKLLFTKASWEASGAGQGTEVASSDLNWPAGTFVQSVSSLTHCGTEFYEVTFNQTSVATISSGDTVTFLFGNPPYAQPGETIFSFIAQPGERATLNLAEIKELTNTTLGGRGTFPNGPDVLAINVYKTAGTAVDANIILRWSEAQA